MVAYAVAVYGTADEPWRVPMLIGSFDGGPAAADFARRLPEQYQWHTLYLNGPDSSIARLLLDPEHQDSDDDQES